MQNDMQMIRSSVVEKQGMMNCLIQFMKCEDSHAQHIIQSIDGSFREVCGRSCAAYDPFATLSYRILQGSFSFIVKETAAYILRYVAIDVNRFSAQYMVEDIKEIGIEPMLEDILDS